MFVVQPICSLGQWRTLLTFFPDLRSTPAIISFTMITSTSLLVSGTLFYGKYLRWRLGAKSFMMPNTSRPIIRILYHCDMSPINATFQSRKYCGHALSKPGQRIGVGVEKLSYICFGWFRVRFWQNRPSTDCRHEYNISMLMVIEKQQRLL